MERIPVTSTNIRAIGYDANSEILEVEFNDGRVYQYSGVPQGENDAIMSADSKGKYLNANIKPRYPYTQV